MPCENIGSVSHKNIMMDYLQINNKGDMAKAVEQFCDEEHGIVFNKHPATNEQKFSDIYEYVASAASISNTSSFVSSTTNCSASSASFVTNMGSSSERLCKEFQKSFQNKNSNITFECPFKRSIMYIKSEDSKTLEEVKSKENIDTETKMGEVTKKEEKEKEEKEKEEKEKEEKEKEEKEKEDPVSVDESGDHLYDIITPDGRGKFQKFIENDLLYVILEDGTHHYYPMNLVKHNRAYLKKNPLYDISYNYKNKVLQHTQNLLKAKKNNLCNIQMNSSANTENFNEYVHFPQNMSYLKDHLEYNDRADINCDRNYLIHLAAKKKVGENNVFEEKYIQDPTCYPIKKNIHVKTTSNVYEIQKIAPYKVTEEEIVDESATYTGCC